MSLPTPRPGILNIPIYQVGESKISGFSKVIKLASNEAALGPSPKAEQALANAIGHLEKYPDGAAVELRKAIAKTHGVEFENVICGAGSDEILALLCRAYAGEGDEIIHTRHAFLMFGIYANSVGATPIMTPETELTADIDKILEAVTPRTRLVFLANPNNPTGTCLPSSEITRLRQELREDIVLVLDGAYAEFVEADNYESGLDLARSTQNTVATRTFSKIYGLASLRLGWAYGPKHIIDALERLRSPFNVSVPAQVAGLAALEDQEHIAKAKAHNSKWRDIAIQRLRGLGLKVGETHANFILPEFPAEKGKSAADADAYLKSKGIIVRRVDGYGLPNYLRITIGNDEEMERVLEELTVFLEQSGA